MAVAVITAAAANAAGPGRDARARAGQAMRGSARRAGSRTAMPRDWVRLAGGQCVPEQQAGELSGDPGPGQQRSREHEQGDEQVLARPVEDPGPGGRAVRPHHESPPGAGRAARTSIRWLVQYRRRSAGVRTSWTTWLEDPADLPQAAAELFPGPGPDVGALGIGQPDRVAGHRQRRRVLGRDCNFNGVTPDK